MDARCTRSDKRRNLKTAQTAAFKVMQLFTESGGHPRRVEYLLEKAAVIVAGETDVAAQLEALEKKYGYLFDIMNKALNFESSCAPALAAMFSDSRQHAKLLAQCFASWVPRSDTRTECLDAVPNGVQVIPRVNGTFIGSMPPPLLKAYTGELAAKYPGCFAVPQLLGELMMKDPSDPASGVTREKLFGATGTVAIASWLAHNENIKPLFRHPPKMLAGLKLNPVGFGPGSIQLDVPASFARNFGLKIPEHNLRSVISALDPGATYPLTLLPDKTLALCESFDDITTKLLAVGAEG